MLKFRSLGFAGLWLLALVLTACATQSPAKSPKINSFTATPATLSAGGGDVTLAWTVSDAVNLSVDQGVGAVSGSQTTLKVSQSTTFTLTATNPSGSTTATANVSVAGSPPPPPPGPPAPPPGPPPPPSSGLKFCNAPGNRTLKVYLAGESIEERNRFVEQPFNCNGTLNQRGGGEASNDNEEYGWMVPLAQRLNLRDPTLAIEFVGSSDWSDANDGPYNGTVPPVPGRTSAISGLDIPGWLDVGNPDRGLPGRRAELMGKTHCYQVAFATRGGNDLNAEVASDDYKQGLKALVKLLLNGSSCLTNPIVYVTTHLPDRFDIEGMERVFLNLAQQAVNELKADTTLSTQARAGIHLVDVYTAFKTNSPTTAFPKPTWFTDGAFDLETIGRLGDPAHPRRLGSVYVGEVSADAMDLNELRTVAP